MFFVKAKSLSSIQGHYISVVSQPIPKNLSNDIAIITARPENGTLSGIGIYEDEILAVMHQENSLGTRDFLDLDDFVNTHLIIHSFPLETVSVYGQFLKPNKIAPLKISAIPLTEVALEMWE